MKRFLLLVCLLFQSAILFAQNIYVSGHLRYPNGKPASGWLLRTEGDATLSDRNGRFNLSLSPNDQTISVLKADGVRGYILQIDSALLSVKDGQILLPPFDTFRQNHLIGTASGLVAYAPPPPPAAPAPPPPQVTYKPAVHTDKTPPLPPSPAPPARKTYIDAESGTSGIGEIAGIIRNNHRQRIGNATVQIIANGIVRGKTVADLYGNFLLRSLHAGVYDMKVSLAGYTTEMIKGIPVSNGRNVTLVVDMERIKSGSSATDSRRPKKATIKTSPYESHLVSSSEEGPSGVPPPFPTSRYEKPLIESGSPGSRSTLTAREIEKMPVRDLASAVSTTPGVLKSGRGDDAPKTTAGKLTSGEVNDFSKWSLWSGASGEALLGHSRSWNLRFKDRYVIRVKGTDGSPQANVPVALKESGSGKMLWQGRTDNTGTAELWRQTSWTGDSNAVNIYVEAQTSGGVFPFQNPVAGAAAQNILEIPVVCSPVRKLDISFIVDATSSMSDEIGYLKAEIEDILKQVGDSLTGTDIRTASVFYRDLGDAYVVKSSPFVAGVAATQQYIAAQRADGGGDGPEAMDLALQENLNKLDWRENAHRLAFLVLDAPPHLNPAIVQRIQTLAQAYAAQGIRLIPVACSGVDKSTEALLRNLALATNGTYVFLTDHSGIGGSHLAPTTDKYDVTYLNGLLYRIIYQFAYMPDCNTLPQGKKTKISQELPGDGKKKEELKWSYYPNPTTGILNVRYEETKGFLYVTDVSGRALLRMETSGTGTTTFDLSNYPSGVYFLRFEYEDAQFVSGKFIVSH